MLSYLAEAQRWAERKRSVFQRINDAGFPLVLFGHTPAVDPGFLQEISVETQYIFDNDSRKWGKVHWGLHIISPDVCPYQDYSVLILVPFEKEIRAQLSKLPTPPQQVFCLDLYFETPDTGAYYEAHQNDVKELCDMLADDTSRKVLTQIIRYRVNREKSYLDDITLPRNTQYFPEQLDGSRFLHQQEVFVDAGAFTGDTVAAFCRATAGKYASIYAFEPDRTNFSQLAHTWSGRPDITCIHAGVGAQDQVVSFVSDTSSSKVSIEGAEQIRVVALDRKLEGIPVTYLKMDVEGMEIAALHGAAHMIQSCKPKLAICTYHSDSDMLEVPRLILKMNPAYRLYFRHYAYGVVETVCYAI